MVVILGDIHLTSRKDYLLQTCLEFLEWYKSWHLNNIDNELILAGDLVDSHVNGGVVIDLLEKFYLYSQFKNIYIVVGNHDKKKVDGYDQLSYEFLKNKSNVHIYEELEEVEVEGLKCLFLPYYLDHIRPMNEVYSNLHKTHKGPYDLVVGHFAGEDNSFKGSVDCILNLDKLNAKKICLGHIHTRFIHPERYIGSIYACNKIQNDPTRSAWYYDGEWKEERLPLFNEFITFSYPDPKPISRAKVPIYTILNCASESIAKQSYGNIYIRKVTIDKEDVGYKKKDLDFEFESIRNINISKLFDEFINNQDPPLIKEVKDECLEALRKGC